MHNAFFFFSSSDVDVCRPHAFIFYFCLHWIYHYQDCFFFFLFMVLDCIGKTGVNCFLFFFHYFSTNLKLFFPLLTY